MLSDIVKRFLPLSVENAFRTKTFKVSLIYLSFLLDNILVTVIVPILPDYLSTRDLAYLNSTSTKNFGHKESYSKAPQDGVANFEALQLENGSVGLLLSSKALVQLLVNPVVALATRTTGCQLPVLVGTVLLMVTCLIFAVGESYGALLFARGTQGVASACLGVSGMCLVAEQYPDEAKRSRVMGIVLGSVALGVLLGYPFGGLLYDFVGKSAPFYIIAVFVIINILLQICSMEFETSFERPVAIESTGWRSLLSDRLILLTAGAICVSTSAMALLEPCLPIWLMGTIRPKKWQLGTVFIPDSLGYLIGTNFLGEISYRIGQWKVSFAALLLVGICCCLIPATASMSQLVWPHFGMGLGIGALDAALVPLLANLVDVRHGEDGVGSSHYGTVYALQQMAVSLAYSLAPLIGGEMAQSFGFPWLMRTVGIINIFYSPLLILLANRSSYKHISEEDENLDKHCATFDSSLSERTPKSVLNEFERME